DGKLPPEVVVRFGHATHTTPEQAARMAKLGIIAEVNLASNHQTGSAAEQKPTSGVDKKRGHQEILEMHDPEQRGHGNMEDHALATLVAEGVPVILSTDGASVMSTDMKDQYDRANQIIREVREGTRTVRVEQDGKIVELHYNELPQNMRDNIDRAEGKFYEDANAYWEKQKGVRGGGSGGPGDPPAGGGPGPGTRTKAERDALLQADRSVSTAQAHATIDLPKDPSHAKEALRDPQAWTAERRAFHDEVIARALEEARAFAEEQAKRGEDPTIFAMRGNTAAGKSRAIKQGGAPELEQAVAATSKGGSRATDKEGLRHRANNPDNFKQEIYEHDPSIGLSSNQAHLESSYLSDRFHEALLGMQVGDKPADMLIDKRLAKAHDTEKLLADAKKSGRHLSVMDVDADLTTSLAGVLGRPHGKEDPIPPFNAVREGFEGVRGQRIDTILAIANEPTASYKLMATQPDGSKVLVAEIKPCKPEEMPVLVSERLIVHRPELIDQLLPTEAEAKSIAKKTGQTEITQAQIDQMTAPLGAYGEELKAKLEPHIGKTWEKAVDDWSEATPPVKAPGAAPDGSGTN
ncbi:MAG: hypothetical protein JO257_25490, partial [Deltaproteobacteria bacterium]|nr:hypothetical protein [Deltaproteobacteria bacterium]